VLSLKPGKQAVRLTVSGIPAFGIILQQDWLTVRGGMSRPAPGGREGIDRFRFGQALFGNQGLECGQPMLIVIAAVLGRSRPGHLP
jgi:hypothetical protein